MSGSTIVSIFRLASQRVPRGTKWTHLRTQTTYVVKCVAIDEKTLKPMVVYHSSADGASSGRVTWVRELELFDDPKRFQKQT